MAEIILPPDENEETPQLPELNIDKPTENSKVITIEFEAKKTNKVSTKDTNQQLYTTDTDAWFEFKETSLEGANGTYSIVFRNRHDGSIFQRTGDVVNGVAYYKIPHQEIRHAGAWRGQLVYTLENGNTTAREFGYDVKGHILDGKDVREIVVEDFETLMSQLRSMKDNAEQELADLVNTAEQNETDRQAFFDDLVEDIDELQANYQELLDTGVLQTNINEKLGELEEEYAPKLTEVTAQLAQTQEQFNQAVGAVTEDSEVVLARSEYTTLKERLDAEKAEFSAHKEDYTKQFPPNSFIENKIKNGNFETGGNLLAYNWSIQSGAQSEAFVKYNPVEKSQKINYAYHDAHLDQAAEIIAGHKYFIKFLVKKYEDTTSRLVVGFANSETELLSDYIDILESDYNFQDYTEITKILNPLKNYNLIGFTGRNGVKSNVLLKDVLLIDLTKTFGVGNEPTIEEVNVILDKIPNRWFDDVEHIKTLGEMFTEVNTSTTQLRNEVDILNEKIITHSIKKKPILPLAFETMTQEVLTIATAYDGNLYVINRINGRILKSVDSGVSFVDGGHPGMGKITGFVVFSDGSIVVVSVTGKFARSPRFGEPFELIQDTGTTFSELNVSSYDNGKDRYILATEYGHTSTMKKIWISKDGGLSYSVLKEGDTFFTGNNHWHTAIFDPYSGGIFASQGDGNNARLYFTPDFGITWNYIEGTQPTSIHAFPNRVVFGRDNTGERPGIHEWDRDEIFPTLLKDALTFREDRWSYEFYPSNSMWNNVNPNEYYLAFPSQIGDTELSYIFATGDGGESWHKVYENTKKLSFVSGIDKQGYVYSVDKDFKLCRAKRLFWEYDIV